MGKFMSVHVGAGINMSIGASYVEMLSAAVQDSAWHVLYARTLSLLHCQKQIKTIKLNK